MKRGFSALVGSGGAVPPSRAFPFQRQYAYFFAFVGKAMPKGGILRLAAAARCAFRLPMTAGGNGCRSAFLLTVGRQPACCPGAGSARPALFLPFRQAVCAHNHFVPSSRWKINVSQSNKLALLLPVPPESPPKRSCKPLCALHFLSCALTRHRKHAFVISTVAC